MIGRDDGLFRGAIAESGFGGVLARYPGGYNATDDQQVTFDSLVRNTSCASTVGTPEAIACLRDAPFEEINTAINVTGIGPWPPALDHDFVADYPTNQIANGNFVHVPIIIGENSDEGSSFGSGQGPNGGPVNTDADFAYAVGNLFSSNVADTTGQTLDEIIDELSYLYPNIQSVGIPSLESWPEIITNDTEGIEDLGLQYRRFNAVAGDFKFHFLRRRSSIAWSEAGLPSYTYRFDVTVNGLPASASAGHFQEVCIFSNLLK